MMMNRFKFDVEIKLDGHDILVRGYAWPLIPARTDGLPEDCSPAEGGEIEDVEMFMLQGRRERRLPRALEEKYSEDPQIFEAVFGGE